MHSTPDGWGILPTMFEVLAFVYENYWQGADCPEPPQLVRKLSAVGFEDDEVEEALVWLTALNLATSESHPRIQAVPAPAPGSLRVFSLEEQNHLGAAGLAYIACLERAGYLSPLQREIVLERACAFRHGPGLELDDLRLIVRMVYWSQGIEPDALLLDELCDVRGTRLAH